MSKKVGVNDLVWTGVNIFFYFDNSSPISITSRWNSSQAFFHLFTPQNNYFFPRPTSISVILPRCLSVTKTKYSPLVWFDYDLVDSDCVIWSWSEPREQPPRLIQGQPKKGHCFAYDAVRSEQHGATLHYPFSWNEVDGMGATTFSWELRGKQGIYQRSRSRRLHGFAPRW